MGQYATENQSDNQMLRRSNTFVVKIRHDENMLRRCYPIVSGFAKIRSCKIFSARFFCDSVGLENFCLAFIFEFHCQKSLINNSLQVKQQATFIHP